MSFNEDVLARTISKYMEDFTGTEIAAMIPLGAMVYGWLNGMDINEQDAHGNTPLHLSVMQGYRFDIGKSKLLIAMGARSNIKNNNKGETAKDLNRKLASTDDVIKQMKTKN